MPFSFFCLLYFSSSALLTNTYIYTHTYSIDWTCQVPLFFFISLVRLVISIPAYQKCVQPSALIKLFLCGNKNEWTYLCTRPEKQSIYLCSSTSGSSSVQAQEKEENCSLCLCLSVDAASNRTCTFILVPYVWICWENVYMCINKKVATIDWFLLLWDFIYQSIYFNQQIDKYD